MSPEKKSLDEWMAEEEQRLKAGFTYQPAKPAATPSTGGSGLAGVGLAAGVVGGALAPHPDKVVFEGCKADVIVNALRSEIASDDTRVHVRRKGKGVVVTILQSQAPRYEFLPALTVTLIEAADTLTVTVSDLNKDVKRSTLGSVGRTLLRQGQRLLFRPRGLLGVFRAAGAVVEGVEQVAEDIHDLGLPKRVWEVIDRVGKAAEEAYWEEQSRKLEQQRKREAAERAWLYCPYCGRAYEEGEEELTNCPACGGARGPKPAWL